MDDYLEYTMTLRAVRSEMLKERLKGFFATVHLRQELNNMLGENPFNDANAELESLAPATSMASNVPRINVTMADNDEMTD